MKTIYTYMETLCVVIGLGWTAVAHAQEEVSKDKDLNREMTLEREYDPSVQDASKVNTLPLVKEPEVRKVPIDYSDYVIPIEPDKEISLLPSGDILTDMGYNTRRGYLNFGIGTYTNIDGDLGYHILSTEKDKLNIWYTHRSSNGKVEYLQLEGEKVKAKTNDNWGGIDFKHVFDQMVFNIGVKYGYSAFNYYGLPMSESSTSDLLDVLEQADRDTKQVNQTIAATMGFQSKEDAYVGYRVNLGYINFSRKYGLGEAADGPTEHTFRADFDVNTRFNGDMRIGLEGQVEYFNYSLPEGNQSASGTYYTYDFEDHAEVTLSPYYKAGGESWHLRLGANVMILTGDDSEFMASPNVIAEVEVADRTSFYLNAVGKLYSNSMYETSLVNRYVDPTSRLAPSRNWLDAVLGIKSGVAPGFWFDIFGGYRITSDDVLFLPSTDFEDGHFGNFSEAMEDIDTKQFFIGANLKYSYQPWADVSLKGVYNHWTASYGDDWIGVANEDLAHAWGKPEVEITASLTIRPVENLSLLVDYYLATGRYTQLYGEGEEKLDNINELNVTGTYTFNDTFGLYAKLNNVLFQDYELYYGYPVQGFHAMIGLNINF